ncbi:MAG: sugar ABC transporter permease [Chloroflexi bacterium]|nr:sugar ABC transporter permease [Chloroflexota bacterium]
MSQVSAQPHAHPRRRQPRIQVGDRLLTHLFIWPTLILLIVMNVFPLFYSLYLSFTEYSGIGDTPPDWVGIENYEEILSNTGHPDKRDGNRYWHNFAVTGRYAVMSVGLQLVVGFSLAMLLKEKFRGNGLVTTLILIPMMLAPAVVGIFWKLIFDPSKGIFSYMMYTSNPRDHAWLADPELALWAIVIVDVWMWSPFVMLLCLAGLRAIPDYLYEAAAIDRASAWFQFRRITLPRVAPLLLIALLFRTIEAFKTFDLVAELTFGNPGGDTTEVIALRLYREAFPPQFNTGESSAAAYIILILVIALSNLYIRALGRLRED